MYMMQCISLTQGIAQAAELIDAQIVFAHLPKSFIPYWTKSQWNALRRQLAQQHRALMEQDMVLLDVPTPPQRDGVALPYSAHH